MGAAFVSDAQESETIATVERALEDAYEATTQNVPAEIWAEFESEFGV